MKKVSNLSGDSSILFQNLENTVKKRSADPEKTHELGEN